MIPPPLPDFGCRSAPVRDFPGYVVTELGAVWSCWRIGGNRYGAHYGSFWHKLKPKTNPDGYQLITTRSSERGQTEHRIHVVVLEAFVGPRPAGMVACHNDGNPANNALSNLRWDTLTGNFFDMHKHGTRRIGARNGNHKLSDDVVREVRRRASMGQMQKQIVTELGLKKSTVSLVVRREIWKHVL